MANIGVLGSGNHTPLIDGLVDWAKENDHGVYACSYELDQGYKNSSFSETIEAIFNTNTLMIVVLIDSDYIFQLNNDKRIEFEQITSTLQSNPSKLILVRSNSELVVPNIWSTFKLFDIEKFGITALISLLSERAKNFASTSDRLRPHPRIFSALEQCFPGKKISSLSGEISEKDLAIGYEIFKISDDDLGSMTVIHTYEPIIIRNVREHFENNYRALIKGKFYLIANRDRDAANPDRRLENLKSAFSADEAWYVDTFIAERLGWYGKYDLSSIPQPKTYFVEPRISYSNEAFGSDTPALTALAQWRTSGNAILVVRGPGGIGKTQLLRKFAIDVATLHRASVVFLDAVSILDYARLNRIPLEDLSLRTLSDLISTQANEQVSQGRLETLFTSDRFLLILDGLDELIPRLPPSFSVSDFFSSIYNLVGELPGGRFLISCRNAYWEPENLAIDVPLYDLKAFDDNEVNEYLNRRYETLPLLRKQTSDKINEMRVYFSDDVFPFILDLAARMASTPEHSIADKSKQEKSFFNDKEVLDEVIWHVCRREASKFGQEGLRLEEEPLNVELQVKLLVELAVNMTELPGTLLTKQAESFFETEAGQKLSNVVFTALKSHPLLEVEQDTLQFSYHFVQEFFLALAVKQALRWDRKVTDAQASSITKMSRLDSNFLVTVARKLGPLSDETTLGIGNFIEKFQKKKLNQSENIDSERWDREVGGAVNIGIQCLLQSGKWDADEATKYLVNLFSPDGKKISDLILYAPNTQNCRVIFTFRGMELENAKFIDYDDFLYCKFDNSTKFRNSRIFGGLFDEKLSTEARTVNFDDNCNIDAKIRSVISRGEKKENSNISINEDILKQFLRSFRMSGYFGKPRNPEILAKGFPPKGAGSFKSLYRMAYQIGIVEDNVGQGGAFIGIKQSMIQEVEDFVDQGLQGPSIRQCILAMVI